MSNIRYMTLTKQLAADRDRAGRERANMREAARAWSAWRAEHPPVKLIGVDLAKQGSGQTAVTLVTPSTPVAAEPDVWHTEAPTVAGVYACRVDGREHERYFDGGLWHITDENDEVLRDVPWERGLLRVQWLRLISADTPPIADWRLGDQVPAAERKQGLWHFALARVPAHVSPANRADAISFNAAGMLYRPAAPGVREGEAYDEARYAKGAA